MPFFHRLISRFICALCETAIPVHVSKETIAAEKKTALELLLHQSETERSESQSQILFLSIKIIIVITIFHNM